jgi:hypothetical protein
MTSAPSARRFSDAVLDAVSSESRKSLHAFAESVVRAEGVLREYHAEVPSAFSRQVADPMVAIQENALSQHRMLRPVRTGFHYLKRR